MKQNFEVISLDGEMSGSDVSRHALLSIGCVRLSDMSTFYAEIQHKEFVAVPAAMRINNLNVLTRDSGLLKTADVVDEELFGWLLEAVPPANDIPDGESFHLVPMGLNVGSFDMPFVRKFLPRSAALLGYRSIDLNALMFIDAMKHGISFLNFKRTAKEIGRSFAAHYVPGKKPHHALYDAVANVGMLEYIVGDLSGIKLNLGELAWDGGNQE